jgi:uncharacterized protein (DUF1800 family)
MLATRPATAQFLCRKLAVRFVSDDPPQSLVDRMARAYLGSGGDIKAVLKTLFRSPEFWSTGAYRAKVKTPIEFVASASRASQADTSNLQPLLNALRDMGMPLYGSVPPTGYNGESANWIGSGQLVNRMNFALSLAANKLPGVTVSWTPALRESAAADSILSAPQEEQRLELMLVADGVSQSTRAALLEQVGTQDALNPAPARPASVANQTRIRAQAATALEKQDELLAGLLLGSPEFQRR